MWPADQPLLKRPVLIFLISAVGIPLWLSSATADDPPKERQAVRSLVGHKMPVQVVAFSPDGKLALSLDKSGEGRLWEVSTGKEKARLAGHEGSVHSAVFSPDGMHILSAGADQTVRLWEVSRGKLRRTFDGRNSDFVSCLAFSADGKQAVSGGGELRHGKTRYVFLRLWSPATGKVIRHFEGHTDPVREVAFAADGRALLSAGDDETVRRWDVATGKELHTTRLALPGPPNRFVFTPDGRRVLSLSYFLGAKVRLWDLMTGKGSSPLAEDWSVHDAAVSRDGRSLLVGGPKHIPFIGGSWGYVVRLIDLPTAKEVRRFESKGVDGAHAVLCVALSPDGKLALTGSTDGIVRLWPLEAE